MLTVPPEDGTIKSKPERWGRKGAQLPLSCRIKENHANKSTCIERNIERLGRIVLPIELRRSLDVGDADSLEIYVDGDTIVLKKYQPACIFCGEARDVVSFKGRNVCKACRAALAGLE